MSQRLRGPDTATGLPGAFLWSDLLADSLLHRFGAASRPRERLWFVIYDIADPVRLRRVARYCENQGQRIQYSVFAALASRRDMACMRAELEEMIDPEADDIRFYRISSRLPIHHRGRSLVPAELLPAHPAMQQLRLALG